MSLDKAIKIIALIFVIGFGLSFFVTIALDVFAVILVEWYKIFLIYGLLFSYLGCGLYFYMELLSPYNTNSKDGSE